MPLREVIYSRNAAEQISVVMRRLLPDASTVNIIADARTFEIVGRACHERLCAADIATRCLIVPDQPDGSSPVCDDITMRGLAARLPRADMLLAVGSGVISDITKWIASEIHLPFMTFATASSMNGYASRNIAPAIKGVKQVLDGVVPLAILADPDILANAPFELTTAGLGDALAKPISVTDWRISRELFGEYYCPLCAQLIRDLEPGYRDHPRELAKRDPDATAALFNALIYSGVAMTMAATSFPASGGEHLISHALDMIAIDRGLQHDYHGRQVGLGTIFASALYERLLEIPNPDFQYCGEPAEAAYWGKLAESVEIENSRKRRRAEQAARCLNRPETWPRILQIIKAEFRAPAVVKQCLADAGAAHTIADIGCSRTHFIDAVLHCHQLRERYTVIDLARSAGILPQAAPEIVDQYMI